MIEIQFSLQWSHIYGVMVVTRSLLAVAVVGSGILTIYGFECCVEEASC